MDKNELVERVGRFCGKVFTWSVIIFCLALCVSAAAWAVGLMIENLRSIFS